MTQHILAENFPAENQSSAIAKRPKVQQSIKMKRKKSIVEFVRLVRSKLCDWKM